MNIALANNVRALRSWPGEIRVGRARASETIVAAVSHHSWDSGGPAIGGRVAVPCSVQDPSPPVTAGLLTTKKEMVVDQVLYMKAPPTKQM